MCCASGEVRKASPEEVTQAKEALATYDSLQCEDQTAFAKAFFSNKGNKHFGFVKDYTEKVSAAKKITRSIQENYFTRIAVLNFTKYMRASLPHPRYLNPTLTIPAYEVQPHLLICIHRHAIGCLLFFYMIRAQFNLN